MLQLWVQAIVLGVALSCGSAAAQTDVYRALTDNAVEEHALGHYSEARALFAQAHAIYPNARTLRGMGVASFEERLYVDAIRLLKAALVHPVKPLTAAQREATEALIRRSSSFVVRVRIALSPRHAHLTVDGRDVEPNEQGEVEVDSGEHHLVATAEGYDDLSRSVRWSAGGGPLALEMRLVPLAGEPAARPVQAQDRASPGPAAAASLEASQPHRSLNRLKWISLGATVASLGVAATAFTLRQSAARAYNDDERCPWPKKETCTSLRSAVQRRELVAISGAAAAGVFSIVSLVSFVIAAKGAERPAQAATTCVPGITPQITCSVRF